MGRATHDRFETTLPSGHRLSLRKTDITEEPADAIVNAANVGLDHGGGVAGAIVRKGGRIIQEESDRIGKVKIGAAAVTGAGKLPSKWVIHAVGPVWRGQGPDDSDRLLASATTAALEIARGKGCESIAFPAISSGIFGFPKDRCARVMTAAIVAWTEANPAENPRDIRLTIIDETTVAVFEAELPRLFPSTPTSLSSKFAGALLGTMVGDALGAPVEGWDCARLNRTLAEMDALPSGAPERVRFDAVVGRLLGGGPVPPGSARYTDDTQMMIGVAESLIAGDGSGVDPEDLARRFAANFQPYRGYGRGAYGVLLALQRGAAWDEPARQLFGGNGSFGNGAAMRAAPIGLAFHDRGPDALIDAATRQSLPTHTHPLGIEGAVLQAAAVAAAVRLDPARNDLDPLAFLESVRGFATRDAFRAALDEIARLLTAPRPPIDGIADALGSGIEAHRSVPAALYAFLAHPDSFADAVRFAVRLGDDTDTVGAMCGAIAGAFHGADAIPATWLDALENGAKGRDYVRSLAERMRTAARGR